MAKMLNFLDERADCFKQNANFVLFLVDTRLRDTRRETFPQPRVTRQ